METTSSTAALHQLKLQPAASPEEQQLLSLCFWGSKSLENEMWKTSLYLHELTWTQQLLWYFKSRFFLFS